MRKHHGEPRDGARNQHSLPDPRTLVLEKLKTELSGVDREMTVLQQVCLESLESLEAWFAGLFIFSLLRARNKRR